MDKLDGVVCSTELTTTVDPADGEPVLLEIPDGLQISLVDSNERPFGADSVTVELRHPDGSSHTSTFTRDYDELPIHAVRFAPVPEGRFTVVVTADDRGSVEVKDVEIGADRSADLTVTVR